MNVNMEIWGHESCQGKQKYSEKTLLSATLSATNSTWSGFGMNWTESNFSNSRLSARFCCMRLLGYGACRKVSLCVADGYNCSYKFSLGNVWKIDILNPLRLIFQRNVIRVIDWPFAATSLFLFHHHHHHHHHHVHEGLGVFPVPWSSNEIGPSISSSVVLCSFVLMVYIHAPGGIRTHDLSRWAACGRSPAEIVGSNPTGGMDINHKDEGT